MTINWLGGPLASGPVLGFQPSAGTADTVVARRVQLAPAPKVSWLDRLDRWFWQQEQNRREAYLAGAADIVELEVRMRKLERAGNGGFL